jgi:hypothetical protein
VTAHLRAQSLHAEVMRQQLLEGQPLLRGMCADRKRGDVGVRRRSMHGQQGFAQRQQLQRLAQLRGDQFEHRIARQAFERARDHSTEAFLAQPFGGRIDRRQTIVRRRCAFTQQARVLRMHHLESVRAVPHFAVANQAHARRELLGLRAIEMEEAQDQGRARVVADRDTQLRAIAKTALDRLDDALDLCRFARTQFADRRDARAVFVAQRQMEPQVLQATQAEPRERLRQRGTDAGQRSHRRRAGVERRGGGRRANRNGHVPSVSSAPRRDARHVRRESAVYSDRLIAECDLALIASARR